jgi:hypothetical protein
VNRGLKAGWGLTNSMAVVGESRNANPLHQMPPKSLQHVNLASSKNVP